MIDKNQELNSTNVMFAVEKNSKKDKVIIKDEDFFYPLTEADTSSSVQTFKRDCYKASQKYIDTKPFVPYGKIDEYEKANYVTQKQLETLFTNIICSERLPVEFVGDLVKKYMGQYETKDILVEIKVINCEKIEAILVVKYYPITEFSKFVYTVFERRHGKRDNMFFPRLATKFFSLPQFYTYFFERLNMHTEAEWREKLDYIKKYHEDFLIINC